MNTYTKPLLKKKALDRAFEVMKTRQVLTINFTKILTRVAFPQVSACRLQLKHAVSILQRYHAGSSCRQGRSEGSGIGDAGRKGQGRNLKHVEIGLKWSKMAKITDRQSLLFVHT